jgi:hypothetical protein
MVRASVGDHEQDEEHVPELHRQILLRLVRALRLVSVPVIHLPRQLTDLLGETRQVGERRPIALLEA